MSRIVHRLAPAQILRLLLPVALLLVLSGCATVRDSRANPFNWFGGETVADRAAPTEVEPETNPLIPRRRESIFRDDDPERYLGSLVSEVTELRIDRMPGGAVVHATGTAASLEFFDVRLVPVETEDDANLTFELRAIQAANTRGQGTEAARRVSVATSLTDQALTFVQRITVIAAENQRSVRR